ncbi:MAG: YopX family protein [Prevotella stercorea]|nr:YopX family protein [Leyella stercorea]
MGRQPAIFEYADFENGCVTIQEKTLGMNTGLRDKNNHEIYGGDILAHNGRVIGHVVDGVRGYCFDVVYADPVSTSTWSLYGVVVNDYEGDVEIVGNIYDNPEVVKGGTQCAHDKPGK